MNARFQPGPERCLVFRSFVTVVLAAVAVTSLGCADGSLAPSASVVAPNHAASADKSPMEGATTPASPAAADAPVSAAVARKIVYNARVSLVVDNLAPIEKKLTDLLKTTGGYIAESDVVSDSESRRNATWKVRVPVEKFESFLGTIIGLGEVQENHVDSQDVTQEFYDIEARIANKQKEEKRLQKHLEDSTGKLEDILAVERELTRVRGEIEQMQGRIRYLSNVSALSTVTIRATEIKNYVAPAAPTFGTQIARTFSGSLESLTRFGRIVVLVLVAFVPWIPVLLIVLLPILWLVRRSRHPRRVVRP